VIVLDASAVLAVLLAEPGADTIAPRLAGSLMASVNLAEVLSKLAERGEDPHYFDDVVRRLGVVIEPVTADQALEAARLRPITKALGLSLGDRLCLAFARERGLPVLTTERRWLEMDFGIPVEFGR
jgi:PIN domain nuclease of toxin-antitoxin system